MGRLEWNRTLEQDRIVLERIRMLLLALAVLVDRAAALPAADRLHVLAILGHGEAVARSFVIEMASGAPAETVAAPVSCDPARLAASFRILALVLGVMLAQARPPRLNVRPPVKLPGREPRRRPQAAPALTPRATSPPARRKSRQRPSSPPGRGPKDGRDQRLAPERWRRAAATEREASRKPTLARSVPTIRVERFHRRPALASACLVV